MLELYARMLDVMDAAFEDYVGALPKPERVAQGDGWTYRYKGRDIQHVVVLKLALIQSALRGALVLLRNGHVFEQAMLQRVIDEANEDVWFLVYALSKNDITPLHQQYLDAFWAEEFDDVEDVTGSHKSREMASRKKIRAYIANSGQSAVPDTSTTIQVTKVLAKTYSGFVHGASPHIMEMYGGAPPRFHTRGMLGTSKMEEYGRDLWNYMYRGLMSHILAAKMFGADEHVRDLNKYKEQFERAAGKEYGPNKA